MYIYESEDKPLENPPVQQIITDTLEQNYMPYAMSVIISRALPEIDGLKPSHRKLLYTMYSMGLLNPNKPRVKSANVVGQTMFLNPHGDMAIYETMVRLTRDNAALLVPFVDSKGNFGKQYSRDMAFAAPRYTEVKLEQVCEELFSEIDKDTVDFVDNYDGTMKEPVLLPVRFPSILANVTTGIAVGMASSICSFNLKELCEATIALLKDANADVMEAMPAPDFPGGGYLLYNEEEMKRIYETGRGSFKIRSKYTYNKAANCIEITEIPYTASIEVIVEKIIDLIKQGKLKEITDIRDETDIKGLKITIDLRRGTDPDKLMLRLFKQTALEDSFPCNFNVLIDGQPRVMGVREILNEWKDFRLECVRRRLTYEIDKKQKQLHLLYGLREILLDIDKAIKIIRNTEEDALVIPNLMDGFGIDKIQAEYVAEIKLRNINKQYILKRLEDIEALEKDIAELSDIVKSDSKMRKVIIRDLQEIIKKYGQPRCTEILKSEEIQVFSEESHIEDYNVKLFLTEQGYFKKITLTSLRSSGEHKLKDGDKIFVSQEATNKSEILFFSDKHNCYKMKAYDLPDGKASALGEYLPNVLEMEPEEKIVYMVATTDFAGFMLFAFQGGKLAKIPLSAYETKTNRKKLINAYSDFSPLAAMLFLPEDAMLCVRSSNLKALVFSSEAVAVKTTKSSRGVQVLTLRRNTTLTELMLAEDSGLVDPMKYQSKNIPAAGFFLKEEDRAQKQIKLFENEGEE